MLHKDIIAQCSTDRQAELGQFDRGAQFDLIKQPGDDRIGPAFALIANQARKVSQAVFGYDAKQEAAPDLLQTFEKFHPALGPAPAFLRAGILIADVLRGKDAAAIDPPRYVPEYAEVLKRIDFRPMTRMEALPFEAATFDLVMAQFAIEYADPVEVLSEARRVLKPHGLLAVMVMPARSTAVHAANKNLKQCRFMLRESRLFDYAIQTCRDLDNAYRMAPDGDHGMIMTPFNIEVEQTVRRFGPEDCDVVLAMVLGLQKVFISRKETSVEEQIVAIQTLRTRLAEYGARSQALIKAAVNDAELEDLKRDMAQSGFKVTSTDPVMVKVYGAVAWRIMAENVPAE